MAKDRAEQRTNKTKLIVPIWPFVLTSTYGYKILIGSERSESSLRLASPSVLVCGSEKPEGYTLHPNGADGVDQGLALCGTTAEGVNRPWLPGDGQDRPEAQFPAGVGSEWRLLGSSWEMFTLCRWLDTNEDETVDGYIQPPLNQD